MTEPTSLICAYIFDGRGGYRELGSEAFTTDIPEEGFLWLHLDRHASETDRWIRRESNIDVHITDALLAEETRPRCTPYGDGFLLNLRGVNLNPGATPEDMVSVRLWIEPNRIVSNRRLRLMAVQDIRDAIATGNVPKRPGDLIARLCAILLDRMEPNLVELSDRTDDLEESALNVSTDKARIELGQLRHRAVMLRRFISPQRDAIGQLTRLEGDWFDTNDRNILQEATNRVTRFAEDLDMLRDRCAAIQDDLEMRMAYQMNRTIYHLSVIAGIFLPLSFVAGLLGANVGGIPGEKHEWGFWVVCGAMALVAAFEIWFFRRRKWL